MEKHMTEQSEQKIQKKISDHLESKHFYVIKLIKTNKNGIPDLVAMKNNLNIFIEVKTEKGKTSKLQDFRIGELWDKDIAAYVVYGYDNYIERIGQYL